MVRIMSDTSTMWSIAEGARQGVTVVPLSVTVGGKTYREYEEIDTMTFVKMVRGGLIPTSSQPSLGETLAAFEALSPEPVLYITMADGLSGTYQTGCAAKNHLEHPENVTVLNSETLCGPHRYLVQVAQKLALAGLSVPEILTELSKHMRTERSFLIPQDYDFLRRGGRLTPLAAKVGSLLRLTVTVLKTADGKRLERYALTRGFEAAVRSVIKNLQKVPLMEEYLISVSHGADLESGELARRLLREAFPRTEVEVNLLSPVFVTQGGPGCVSIQIIHK